MRFFSTIFLPLLFIVACNDKESDFKLSGGYTFLNKGKDYKVIKGESIFQNHIGPNVKKYTFNDDFILIEQAPSFKYLKGDLVYVLMARYYAYDNLGKDASKTMMYTLLDGKISMNNTIDDIKKTEKIVDSLVIHDSYYRSIFSNKTNYWIIQIKGDTLIGPLTKSEFVNARLKLKIPNSLELEIE